MLKYLINQIKLLLNSKQKYDNLVKKNNAKQKISKELTEAEVARMRLECLKLRIDKLQLEVIKQRKRITFVNYVSIISIAIALLVIIVRIFI